VYSIMTKLNHRYPNWIIPQDFKLPDSLDEKMTDPKIKQIKEKYIIVLAKIFAGYFNDEYNNEATKTKIIDIYEKKFLPVFQNFDCDKSIIYFKKFLQITSLYFSKEITVEKENTQLGGAGQIVDIMTPDQKNFIEKKSTPLKNRYEEMMKNMIPYDGFLDTAIINAYFNEVTPSKELVLNVINYALDEIELAKTTITDAIAESTKIETDAKTIETDVTKSIPEKGEATLIKAEATPAITKTTEAEAELNKSDTIDKINKLKEYVPTTPPTTTTTTTTTKTIVITPDVTKKVTELAKESVQLTSLISKLFLAIKAIKIILPSDDPLKTILDNSIFGLNKATENIKSSAKSALNSGADTTALTTASTTKIDKLLLQLSKTGITSKIKDGVIGEIMPNLEILTFELKYEINKLMSNVKKGQKIAEKKTNFDNSISDVNNNLDSFIVELESKNEKIKNNLIIVKEVSEQIKINLLKVITKIEELKTELEKAATAAATATIAAAATASNFNYKNILNLILSDNFYNSVPSDVEINKAILDSSEAWFHLFNESYFIEDKIKVPERENKYLNAIKETINAVTDIKNIDKIPVNQNQYIKPLFRISNLDDSTTTQKLTMKTKKILTQLYNFEQAFIIQLKVFLLYNYIKLNNNSLLNSSNTPGDSIQNDFFLNFKKNFIKYYSIIKLVVTFKLKNISQVQRVNIGYMVSSSIGVISYCIKKISSTSINRVANSIIDSEMSILEDIYLTSNLNEGSASGDPDKKLIEYFKSKISDNLLPFFPNSNYTISKTNPKPAAGSPAKIMKHLQNLPTETTNKKNNFYINNAVTANEGLENYFCPFSSILDGQSICNSYESSLNHQHPIEEGNLNILVRDGYGSSETMRYHVKIDKSKVLGDWDLTNAAGKKFVNISVYLKVGGQVLINMGWEGETDNTYNHTVTDTTTGNKIPDPVIGRKEALKVNLNKGTGVKSPFDAKDCIEDIINNNIKLITNFDNSLKTWGDFLNIINSDATPSNKVSTQYGTATNPEMSRDLFRRKIIETSFVKSLGDYLQEINTVADNGGYTNTATSIDTSNGNKVLLEPNKIRLGLANDRPSGVRMATFLLFGLYGINPKAIGGFYTQDSFVIASRDKTLLKNPGQTIAGGSIEKYKIYKSVNNTNTKRVKNLTKKRRKNITKKRKKILKNKKISKRNNKGTRKRR